jgi:hypothetical protein
MALTYQEAMNDAWGHINEIQGNQKASILRYTVTGRDPAAGVAGTKTLVAGLADLDVDVEDVSASAQQLSQGKLDMKSKTFVFNKAGLEVFTTDQITHAGSTYSPFAISKVVGTNIIKVICARTGGPISGAM